MLSIDHPFYWDGLLKDIPDNKAFYPCAGGRAKSHLKWAEALRIRVVFGIRELLRRFGYFWALKVTNKFYREIFHSAGVFPNMESTYLAPIPFWKPPRLPKKLYALHKKKPQSLWLSKIIFSNIKLLYRQYLRQERFLELI